jgi:arylformamidase
LTRPSTGTDEKDLSQIRLGRLANLAGFKISAKGKPAIEKPDFPDAEGLAGKAVLVETGWSRYWNTARYFERRPFLTEAAARFLVASGAALVGIDSGNIDDAQDLRRPVHCTFLEREIPIVERMTNKPRSIAPDGFRFFAARAKVAGFGTFPVRAFAVIESSRH